MNFLDCRQATLDNIDYFFHLTNKRWNSYVIPKMKNLKSYWLYTYKTDNDTTYALGDDLNNCVVGPLSENNIISNERDIFKKVGFNGIYVPENEGYDYRNKAGKVKYEKEGKNWYTYFTYYPRSCINFGVEYKIADSSFEYCSKHKVEVHDTTDTEFDFFNPIYQDKILAMEPEDDDVVDIERWHRSFTLTVDDEPAYFCQYYVPTYKDYLYDNTKLLNLEWFGYVCDKRFLRDEKGNPTGLGRLFRIAKIKAMEKQYPGINIILTINNEYAKYDASLHDCFLSCRTFYPVPIIKNYFGKDIKYTYFNRNYHRKDAFLEKPFPDFKLNI